MSARVVIMSSGRYLTRFWLGWAELGDDPTTWTSDRRKALRMTPERAARILPTVAQWQPDPVIQS